MNLRQYPKCVLYQVVKREIFQAWGHPCNYGGDLEIEPYVLSHRMLSFIISFVGIYCSHCIISVGSSYLFNLIYTIHIREPYDINFGIHNLKPSSYLHIIALNVSYPLIHVSPLMRLLFWQKCFNYDL